MLGSPGCGTRSWTSSRVSIATVSPASVIVQCWLIRWHGARSIRRYRCGFVTVGKKTRPKPLRLESVAVILDDTDRKILDALVEDARRSASEVGRLVGLSPPAAKRRIDRLEAVGFIRRYTA